MSIRSESLPYGGQIAYPLLDLLRRNGMNAQLILSEGQPMLQVQSHDSPVLQYKLSEMQFDALAQGGTNFLNRRAYDTFNKIVGNDFDLPATYVAARNVGSRVNMTPYFRMGRTSPGEIRRGDEGYHYKGQFSHDAAPTQTVDSLVSLQSVFPKIAVSEFRQTTPAIPYSRLITSDVYFTNDRWQEVLRSHGVIVDVEKNTLTIQPRNSKLDFYYDLNAEDVKRLTDNSLSSTSIQQRLDIINGVIASDFDDKITAEMLDEQEVISLKVKPESLWQSMSQQVNNMFGESMRPPDNLSQQPLDERKGWYREGRHGREVEVGDIWVEKNEQPDDKVTYKMSAVINGEVISHEINKRQFDRFLAVDDYQRQRMMSKIFDEVDLKTRPERRGFNIGAFVAAGLTAISEATGIGAEIAHNIEHIRHPHSAPDLYAEVHGTGRIFFKPGVDSPQDIAQRAFEAGMNAGMYGGGPRR